MVRAKRRRITRGKPITELVKGSFNYTLHIIERAFYRAHRDGDYWIQEVFDEYIVVDEPSLAIDEYFRVPYTRNGPEFDFAPRSDWEIVELAYRPRDPVMTERRRVLVDFTRSHVRYTCEHTRCKDPKCESCARHVWGHGPFWFAEAQFRVSHRLGGASIQRRRVLLGEQFIEVRPAQ